MRTVFVNPRRRTRRKRKTTTRRRRRNAPSLMGRARRTYGRRRRAAPAWARPMRRRRKRNVGITSFVAPTGNPLILSNPRHRRRSKSNPKLNLKTVMNKILTFGGGGALGYAVNQFGLSNIENDWGRRAAQAGTAVLGSMFLKGELGAAFAGATMYPLMADLAAFTGLVGIPTEADLDELSADLEQALGEGGEVGEGDGELYIDDELDTPIDDFEPMANDNLVDW